MDGRWTKVITLLFLTIKGKLDCANRSNLATRREATSVRLTPVIAMLFSFSSLP
jgi:hypothetical protein